MGLTIHHGMITQEIARQLLSVCPFNGLDYQNGRLSFTAGCKGCKLCVKKGPSGAVTWETETPPVSAADKRAWRGVAVYAERRGHGVHPVTFELLGKAKELSRVTGHPVYALAIGSDLAAIAQELLHFGADRVFLYDDPAFAQFTVGPYANAFYDFIRQQKPSSILVGATNLGRSLAPKVAARCNTGLTADCTVLEMKKNTDLVQIRPAFGGNIMAQIVTANARPQFCTVRCKIFSAPARSDTASGEIVRMPVTPEMRVSRTKVLSVTEKPREVDIADADVIVACGRGFQKEADLDMARELSELLHGQLAGTRPLIEAGWLNPKQQIGLSGRTVKPKLIITLGVSGSVQFAAGMKGSDCIIAVNRDQSAGIFDVAHIGVVGDLYEIVPMLIERIKGGAVHV